MVVGADPRPRHHRSACARRHGCAFPAHLFVPAEPAPRSLRRSSDRDRLRSDDLPALHRRLLARGTEAGADPSRARDRDRLGIPDRAARRARGDGVLDSRSSSRWPPALARSSSRSDYRNVQLRVSDGYDGLARARAVRSHRGRRRARTDAARAGGSSSWTAGSSRCPSASANQELRVCRWDGDRLATARDACRSGSSRWSGCDRQYAG